MLMNMKIGSRLLLGFGLVLLITVGMGIAGFTGLRSFSATSMELIDINSHLLEQATRFQHLNNEMRRFEKDVFINIGSADEMNRYFQQWGTSRDAARQQLMEIKGFMLTRAEKVHVQRIEAALYGYFTGFTLVADEIRAGRYTSTQEANRAMERFKSFTHDVDRLGEELVAQEKQTISDGQQRLLAAKEFTSLLIATGTIGSTLLCIILTLLFTRSITRPLSQLTGAARQIAEGNLDIAIGIDSRDEVGQLADSFRYMVANLQHSITALNEQAFQLEEEVAERQMAQESLQEQAIRLEEEIAERQMAQENLQEQSLQLEEEVAERQMAQETLQEQAAMLEEEVAERQAAQAELLVNQRELEELNRTLEERIETKTRKLRKSEEQYRLLLDSTAEAIYGVDTNGDCTFCNPACLRMLGYETVTDLIGRNMHLLMHHTREDGNLHPAEECPISAAFRNGENVHVDSELLWRADGSSFPAEFWAHPQKSDGVTVGAVVSFIDITERKTAAEELQRAKEAADSANSAKSAFLANMSHEIRTPLNAIIGFSYLALKSDLTPRQHDYIQKINRSGESLLGIINDILDFSKVEAGKLDMESIPFYLDHLLANVTNQIQVKAVDKKIAFFLDRPATIPSLLNGDPLRLGQVLTNLVGNAVKFTEQGEVELSIECAGREEGRVRLLFSVRDTGIGLTPEQCSRLFQAFSQVDGSTTRKYGGTGLGLSICKHLVEMMGGEIRVKSEPAVGTVFTFDVWFGVEGEEQVQTRFPATLTGSRVLVVDDSATSRSVLNKMLASLPLRVDCVCSAREAIEAVRRADGTDPYRLILMDWQMPGMDGIEATRLIKRDRSLVSVPAIVVITSFGGETEHTLACEAGADDFLHKPFTPTSIVAELSRIFSPSGQPDLAATSRSEESRHDFSGFRILLADDNELNRQITVELLSGMGALVDEVCDGREAVEKVTAAGTPYDLVLMDIQMPGMDGYEATRFIRADDRFKTLPVIAMTAHAMAEEREMALNAGMNDLVTKPINLRVLLAAISSHLPRKGVYLPSVVSWKTETTGDGIVIPDIPGVDVAEALDNIGGSRKLYLWVVKSFLDDQAGTAPAVEKALADGDRILAERLVHTTRGVVGSIGAFGMAAVAAELEASIKEIKSPEIIREKLQRFTTDLAALAANLTAVLAGIEERGADIVPAGTDEVLIGQILNRLLLYIRENDSRAGFYLEEYRATLTELPQEEMEWLGTSLASFDYETALAALTTLAVKSGIGLIYTEEEQ